MFNLDWESFVRCAQSMAWYDGPGVHGQMRAAAVHSTPLYIRKKVRKRLMGSPFLCKRAPFEQTLMASGVGQVPPPPLPEQMALALSRAATRLNRSGTLDHHPLLLELPQRVCGRDFCRG
jgi:hypothetical protein